MAILPQNLSRHQHFYLLVAWPSKNKSPQLLDQSKHKYISIFALSANTFRSDQIEDHC